MSSNFHLRTITRLSGTTALVAASALIAATSGAYAQGAQADDEDSFALEEIVVTSRRRSELMQDVPISIAAISRLELDRSGYETLADVTLGVPNFTFADRGPILGDFGIRGIATNISTPGVESAMAVYIDGVLVGRPQGFDTSLQGIEQVEVLRGPQGTLFGKNTIAGALNITTQRPTEDFSGNVKLEVGRFERGMSSGSLNIPLSDTVSARISASVEREDGWIKNLFDDRRFNGENNWAGRIQLLAKPSEKLEIYLTADRFYDQRNAIGQINDDPQDLKSNPLTDPLGGIVDIDSPSTSNRNLWGGSMEINYLTDGGYNFTSITGFRHTGFVSLFDGDTQRQRLSDTTATDSVDQWTQEFRIASPEGGKLDWVAGAYAFFQDLKGSTQTRFYPKNILAGCAGPVTPQSFRGFPPPPPFENIGTVTGFTDEGLPIWEFVGNPLIVQGCTNPDLIAFGRHIPGGDASDFFVSAFDPGRTVDDVDSLAVVHEFGFINTDAFALFAQGNYHFTERLTLTAGIRHTWEDKDLKVTQQGMINIKRPTFTTTDTSSDREFSGNASLSFKVSEDVTVYAKYAHGFKSGGFQFDITQGEKYTQFEAATKALGGALKAGQFATKEEFIAAAIALGADPNEAPDNLKFALETVNVYEGGIKATLMDNRLRINAAGFFTDYNDLQQNILDLRTGIIVLNIPGSEVYGFEIDVDARPTEGLSISGGLGMAKTKITVPLIVPNPAGGPPLIDSSSFLGLRLGQAPEWTANAAITYSMPVGQSGSVVIRGEWSYTGSIFHELDPDPNQRAKVLEGAYSIFNGRIGYVSDVNDWDVFFWGKNIGSKEYAAFRRANPIMRNFGGGLGFPGNAIGQVVPGKTATWGLTLQKHF